MLICTFHQKTKLCGVSHRTVSLAGVKKLFKQLSNHWTLEQLHWNMAKKTLKNKFNSLWVSTLPIQPMYHWPQGECDKSDVKWATPTSLFLSSSSRMCVHSVFPYLFSPYCHTDNAVLVWPVVKAAKNLEHTHHLGNRQPAQINLARWVIKKDRKQRETESEYEYNIKICRALSSLSCSNRLGFVKYGWWWLQSDCWGNFVSCLHYWLTFPSILIQMTQCLCPRCLFAKGLKSTCQLHILLSGLATACTVKMCVFIHLSLQSER